MQGVLAGILIVTTLVLFGMGLRQWRRQRSLARVAGRRGLKFSSRDPFGLPERYAGCAIMRIGHSPSADNVLFGRWAGGYVRAFDFRCEAGHGPHRLPLGFTVVAADIPTALPTAMAWRLADPNDWLIPQAAAVGVAADGKWNLAGDTATAGRLRQRWNESGDQSVLVEVWGGSILFASPGRLGEEALNERLEAVSACVEAIQNDSTEAVGG